MHPPLLIEAAVAWGAAARDEPLDA